MPIPGNDHYEPGDRELSASQLNAVVDAVRGLMSFGGGGPGMRVGWEGGAFQVTADPVRKPFWAKITAEGEGISPPNKYGYYAWEEVGLRADGSFYTPTDYVPRKGQLTGSNPDPARDIFFKTGVPVGLPVMLLPMPPTVGGAAGNWLFLCPDLVQVVRFGPGPRNPDGDYDGYVQRWDPAGAFVDAEPIWITVP